MRYQPKTVERVRLDVTQQPFHGDEGNNRRHTAVPSITMPLVFLRRALHPG